MNEVTLSVCVASEVREVTFKKMNESSNFFYSAKIFTARVGQGAKTHTAQMVAIEFNELRDAERAGYSKIKGCLVEHDNKFYGLKTATVANRTNVYITGWVANEAATSEHKRERKSSK